MNLDLSTHSAAINDALNKVRAGKDIDWALLSIDGKTNTLTVSGTGKGGLDELEEEFNDGKIEFAFIRVVDENSQLPKNVFISWCGEGVPENKKGFLQIHTSAVEKLVKGYHVHIAARSTKDVDKATVMKKVRDSSGANYSFHKETSKPDTGFQPVGSNYQKPEIVGRSKNPPPVAAKSNANDVAEKRKQQELEERQRAQEEQDRKNQDEQKKNQEEQNKARQEQDKKKEQERQQREEDQRRQREDQERRQREDQERRQREDQDKNQREEEQRRQREDEQRRQREDQERRQHEEQERQQREQQEREQQQAASQSQSQSQGATSGGFTATVLYDYDAGESNEISLRVGDVISNIEMIDEGWWQGQDSQGNFGMFPSTYVQKNEEEFSAPSGGHSEPTTSGKPSALALYAYDASEEGEISFGENETITDINFIDDNWWQGTNAQGYYGMFPSNYVQLNQ